MSHGAEQGFTLMTEAFESFERAASWLQKRHGSLRSEVERLERELGDAHRRLETVIDVLETGVAVLSPEGYVLRSNRALAEMGFEETGLHLSKLAEQAAAGSARLRQETPSGERDLAATLIPVGDEDGTRVLTVQDVTDIRLQEEEGGRRRRLEALGRMAAELAHEVRNPLGSIQLFATMLRDDLQESPQLREMADHIIESTSNLEATVSNLLAFASPHSAEKREIDLRQLAAESCSLFSPACALRGVHLEGPADGAECTVLADPEGMRQVVLNLLGNALAAAGEGGSIEVDVLDDGESASLVVRDDGCGISPEDLPRVFDPFFSRSEGGTGLGLSIVHRIVERHMGRIALDSIPGRGTVATVEIASGPMQEESHG
jgi:signal transduction histidine kinase